jgi:hypothetical protein
MARQMTSSQFHKSKTLDNKYVSFLLLRNFWDLGFLMGLLKILALVILLILSLSLVLFAVFSSILINFNG